MATYILSRIALIALICLSIEIYKHNVVLSFITPLTSNAICKNIPGLVVKQRLICQSRPDAMVSIGTGAELAAQECQWQFRKYRWNCTLGSTTSLQLGNSLPIGSREAGFAISVKSASIAHSITQSCSNGMLRGCGCDTKKKDGSWSNEGWEWGGCSADVNYGLEFSRVFVDANDTDETPRSLMNLHNSRAGRKILKKSVKVECKCHGASGSCTMKTCWMTLPSIREVGNLLMKRYRKAKKVHSVELRNHRKKSLKLYRAKRNSAKTRPSKGDLVFLEDSPNYCDYNQHLGSLGTVGRRCNKTSADSDSCQVLCCDRGYNTHEYTKTWQCDCKFHWCCHVTCKECREKIDIYSCK